jgi:diguanylate cyclase (GGDEF)-like protein
VFQRLKFVAFVLLVFVLYALTKGDLGNIRTLTTDTSYFAVQLAEASRLEKEMLQFRHDAESFVRGDAATTHDTVKLSFDLLWARVNTEATRPVDSRIKTIGKYRPELAKLAAGMKDIDHLVQNLSRHDIASLAGIEKTMRASARAMTRMNEESYRELYQTSADLVVMQRNAFHSLDRVQWILVMVGLCGFITLLWHLRKDERLYGELMKREAEIRILASTDPLTGLNNRRHFDERMHAADNGHWPGEMQVILIDLDDFKQINDAHGHEAGDRVLREVAARIQASAGHEAVLARLGGDEFGILLSGPCDKACEIAGSIIEVLQQPVIHASKALRIGASIGVSSRPPGPKHTAAMLREADKALYEAKNGGRKRYAVFGEATARSGGCKSAA